MFLNNFFAVFHSFVFVLSIWLCSSFFDMLIATEAPARKVLASHDTPLSSLSRLSHVFFPRRSRMGRFPSFEPSPFMPRHAITHYLLHAGISPCSSLRHRSISSHTTPQRHHFSLSRSITTTKATNQQLQQQMSNPVCTSTFVFQDTQSLSRDSPHVFFSQFCRFVFLSHLAFYKSFRACSS